MGDMQKLKIASKSVFGIIDRESEIDSTNETGIKDGIEGEIEFRNVYSLFIQGLV